LNSAVLPSGLVGDGELHRRGGARRAAAERTSRTLRVGAGDRASAEDTGGDARDDHDECE